MSKSDLDNLLTVTDLSALRKYAEMDCATDQGIRAQMKLVLDKKKTEEEVGFQLVKLTGKVILLRLLDKDLEIFRKKMADFAKANKPDKK